MFPAGAGMNREPGTTADRTSDVPRWRGDEPQVIRRCNTQHQCSPLARG